MIVVNKCIYIYIYTYYQYDDLFGYDIGRPI